MMLSFATSIVEEKNVPAAKSLAQIFFFLLASRFRFFFRLRPIAFDLCHRHQLASRSYIGRAARRRYELLNRPKRNDGFES